MTRRIIGLTGGIATGKSTVSEYLSSVHHLPVLDADVYAREAVAPGSPILAQLAQRYGEDILLSDGNLDRAKLGEIIFNNADEKRWVEQQIHPFVRQRFQTIAQTYAPEQALVYVIPLLFEARLTSLVTEIWVVVCPLAQQLERLMARNQLTQAQAQSRIKSQMPLREKM
ncbi:MAG: dephospho-CoA kinase, partial [Cyanobacteria bacterium P01_D01_bin.44]